MSVLGSVYIQNDLLHSVYSVPKSHINDPGATIVFYSWFKIKVAHGLIQTEIGADTGIC